MISELSKFEEILKEWEDNLNNEEKFCIIADFLKHQFLSQEIFDSQ